MPVDVTSIWATSPDSPFLLNPYYQPPPLAPGAIDRLRDIAGLPPQRAATPVQSGPPVPIDLPGSPFLLNPSYIPPPSLPEALDRWQALIAEPVLPLESAVPLPESSVFSPPGSPFLLNPNYVPPPLPAEVVDKWRQLTLDPAPQPIVNDYHRMIAEQANAGDYPFVTTLNSVSPVPDGSFPATTGVIPFGSFSDLLQQLPALNAATLGPPVLEAQLGLRRQRSSRPGRLNSNDITQGILNGLSDGGGKYVSPREGDPRLRLAHIQWLASFYHSDSLFRQNFQEIYLRERVAWAKSQGWAT